MGTKITKKLNNSFGLQLVDEQEKSIPINTLPAAIGRSELNDIHLEDEAVSINHARVYYDDNIESVCIEDLGSSNGIYIENKPTLKNVLWDGATIKLGTTRLIFRDTGYIPPDS